MTRTLRTRIEKVLEAHRDTRHFMQGGRGVCCYVWVNGLVVSSENCLRLDGNVYADLCAIEGVHSVKINID